MSGWAGSTRRRRLPANWRRLREVVIERAGGICEHRDHYGNRCWQSGTDVDHIEPNDDHSLENLQLLCRRHHAAKSGREGRTRSRSRALAAHES